MATISKTTPAGTWKAIIRKLGWPSAAKNFRTKRDAEDGSRRTEDEMVRGVYIQRSQSERLTVAAALDRYLKEVTPTKKKPVPRLPNGINRTGLISISAIIRWPQSAQTSSPTIVMHGWPTAKATTLYDWNSHY